MLKILSRRLILALAGVAAMALAGPATATAAEGDKPILTVDGALAGGPVAFSREALADLGAVALETATPWTEGVRRFVGAPLAAVLDAAGARGDSLRAHALNDYSAAMPIADVVARDALLVWSMDDRILGVRDKGPLWLLFDFDGDASVRTDAYLARSVWQLTRITVE